MSNLFNLVLNENMKIYRRIGTWVMIGLLLLSVLAGGILDKFIFSSTETNWQEDLVNQNIMMEKSLSQENIPLSMKNYYEKQLAINEYRLENNIPPIKSKSLWGFMNSSSNMISIVTLFTVIIAAGIVAGEFSSGTIKLLLIRPVNRSKILFSKYIASLLFALVLLIILFIFSFVIGVLFYGLEGVNEPYLAYSNGQVVEQNMVLHVISLYGYSNVNLVMMVTFAFMISTVFRSNSLSIGLAIFLMFTGGQLVNLLSQYDWVKYILFANTNLMQYIDGTPIVKGMTLEFSIIILIAYFIVFNSLSFMVFKKRDVSV